MNGCKKFVPSAPGNGDCCDNCGWSKERHEKARVLDDSGYDAWLASCSPSAPPVVKAANCLEHAAAGLVLNHSDLTRICLRAAADHLAEATPSALWKLVCEDFLWLLVDCALHDLGEVHHGHA